MGCAMQPPTAGHDESVEVYEFDLAARSGRRFDQAENIERVESFEDENVNADAPVLCGARRHVGEQFPGAEADRVACPWGISKREGSRCHEPPVAQGRSWTAGTSVL